MNGHKEIARPRPKPATATRPTSSRGVPATGPRRCSWPRGFFCWYRSVDNPNHWDYLVRGRHSTSTVGARMQMMGGRSNSKYLPDVKLHQEVRTECKKGGGITAKLMVAEKSLRQGGGLAGTGSSTDQSLPPRSMVPNIVDSSVVQPHRHCRTDHGQGIDSPGEGSEASSRIWRVHQERPEAVPGAAQGQGRAIIGAGGHGIP